MKRKIINLVDKFIVISLCILIILFILYPFLAILVYGGKDNILEIFLSDYLYYLGLLFNSLKVAFSSMLLTTIVSIFVAIYFFIGSNKVKNIVTFIFLITMISPPFVTALSYINLFGRRGFITYNLLKLNINPYGVNGIILMQSVNYIAISSLLLIGFIKNIDKEVINSARSLGASTTNIIIDIIFPLLKPAVKVVMLLTFVRSMADFGTPAIIGGKYNVLSSEGYFAFISEGNIPKAVLLNVIILIPSIVVFVIYSKNLNNSRKIDSKDTSIAVELSKKSSLYRLSAFITVFVCGVLVILYGAIILSAFSTMEYGKLVFTLENFREASDYIEGSFLRSIVYAFIVGVVSSILGHIFQYYIHIRNIKFLKVFDFIATLPYIIPGTFFGLGYVLAFNDGYLKLTGTAFIVIANLLFKQFPFATKIGYSSVTEIGVDQLKTVRDLGGNKFNEVFDVVFPLSKSGLYISFINGFTSTMTTIGSIIFLVYPSQKLATLVLFDVIESGKYDIGAVIAFYIMMICIGVNLLYYFIINRKDILYNVRIKKDC